MHMHKTHILLICACCMLTGCSVSIEPAALTAHQTQAASGNTSADPSPAVTVLSGNGLTAVSYTTSTSVQPKTAASPKPNTSALTEENKSEPAATKKQENSSGDWMLRLANKTHPVGEYVPPELVTLRNGTQVDARMYPALQEMYDQMRAEGLQPMTREAYRTYAQQEDIMQTRIRQHKSEGKSAAEAKTLAEMYVAVPGTSEHQLGLAVDVNSEDGNNTKIYNWLAKNAYRYGFIQRYPEGKEDITGFQAEAWHYRYVGKEAAKVIREKGITLEEYLGAE
ncbi:MAG: D-alanyl-D-alanine carboxypeptidase family protein [Oscillospiraceae bacterium]|nr:D-alanyl-D-alanine carboxypeptidase family protein [Oscillospiraceae bacterium]